MSRNGESLPGEAKMEVDELDANTNDSSLSNSRLEYPPIIEWGLDPLYSSYRKLFIYSIHSNIKTLIESNEALLCHYYFHRPIRKVEVCGVVISIERTLKRYSVLVDDGTGCINCIKYLNPNLKANSSQGIVSFAELSSNVYSMEEIQVGDLVIVKGNLEKLETNFLDYQFMIKIAIIEKQDSLEMETFWMLQTMHLTKTVYSKPLDLPQLNS